MGNRESGDGRRETEDGRRKTGEGVSLSTVLATLYPIGFIPGGPGTYGAIVATPAAVWLSTYPWEIRMAGLGWLIAASCYWSHEAGKQLGEPDSGHIIIDEVVGLGLGVVFFSDLTWLQAGLGLLFFRIFDIWKIYPSNRIDQGDENGITVVLDDLIAGLWTALALLGITFLL